MPGMGLQDQQCQGCQNEMTLIWDNSWPQIYQCKFCGKVYLYRPADLGAGTDEWHQPIDVKTEYKVKVNQ